MSKIDDLSYSNIIGLVNHCPDTAKELLIQIAKEKEVVDNNLQSLEVQLQELTTRHSQLKKGSLLVLKHLKKETPLAVRGDELIVVVSDSNISIERNVLQLLVILNKKTCTVNKLYKYEGKRKTFKDKTKRNYRE